MKKLLVLVFVLLSIFLGGATSMRDYGYIEVYDQSHTFIANIKVLDYQITRNVIELDVSTFQGDCETDISSGFAFILRESNGEYVYSGFMKNIVQDENYVSFKGEDFKSIFDSEVLLDFSQNNDTTVTMYSLNKIFTIVENAIEDSNPVPSAYMLDPDLPADYTDTEWLGNYDGTYFIANALTFLKTYLIYYHYYLNMYLDENSYIHIDIVTTSQTAEAALEDFIFSKTLSDIKVNHTIATIKFDTSLNQELSWINTDQATYNAIASGYKFSKTSSLSNKPALLPDGFAKASNYSEGVGLAFTYSLYIGEFYDYYITGYAEHRWAESNQAYYDAQDSSNKLDQGYSNHWFPNVSADDYDIGFAIKVSTVSTPYRYYRCYANTQPRPTDLLEVQYYLGKDNEIYESVIDGDLQIYPVKTKIFEDETLAKAQYNAIWELVNGRYNMNVVIDNKLSPVDVSEWGLFDMITVYDKYGTSYELPVTQIVNKNGDISVKLGFKKTLFTEVIKEVTGSTESAITTKNKKILPVSKYQLQ